MVGKPFTPLFLRETGVCYLFNCHQTIQKVSPTSLGESEFFYIIHVKDFGGRSLFYMGFGLFFGTGYISVYCLYE
ncbi:hypothetical protein N480_16135 [Pseudoalteromonas luteoviolacea S2607]|nr:hypothetical protein N480_16135 [Pseudoalteromonas luteoviolacea S2607]